jgi:hypothetical protein
MFAMGALGALLGVWIAWSKSQVVVAVLPLLFGLIGGAGGYSLLKMDFSRPHNKEKLRIVGMGLGCLCATCLIFMTAAILARPWMRDWEMSENIDIQNSASPLEAITMRARLRALGASGDEIKYILKPSPPVPAVDKINLIANDADEYVKSYDGISLNDQAGLQPIYQEVSPRDLANWCRIFLIEKDILLQKAKLLDDNHNSFLISPLITIRPIPSLTINSLAVSAQQLLVKYPKLITTRVQLVDDLQAIASISQVGLSEQQVKEADQVIETSRAIPKQTGNFPQIADSPVARF